MKAILKVFLCAAFLFLLSPTYGQSKKVTESVRLSGETELALDFSFANQISFKTWEKNEVLVEVTVNIMDGKYNDIFTLSSEKLGKTVLIEMDKKMWDKIDKEDRKKNCNWTSKLDYVVYLPKSMQITAETISGDYELNYFGSPLRLKTISGEIDLTIPSGLGLDFRSKTISGEIYSDMDIDFPDGKDGLNQLVGQKIRGRIRNGGEESAFETISGNIYLRKG